VTSTTRTRRAPLIAAWLIASLSAIGVMPPLVAQAGNTPPVLHDDSGITYQLNAEPNTSIVVPLPLLEAVARDPQSDELMWVIAPPDQDTTSTARQMTLNCHSLTGNGGIHWALTCSIGEQVPPQIRVDLVLQELNTPERYQSDDRLTVILNLSL